MGAPIIALHGLLDSPEAFDGMPVLAPRVPQNRPSFPSRITWLRGWIEEESIQDFHLLGHSLGGALAAAATEHLQPQTLLLLAPVGFGQVPLSGVLHGPLREPLRRASSLLLRSDRVVGATYRHLFSSGSEIPSSLRHSLQRDPSLTLRRAEREMEIVHQLSRNPLQATGYEGPVGALWGEHDRLVPWRGGQEVKRVFPQATVTRLGGVGHDPLREDPAGTWDWIEEFIEKSAQPGSV